MKVLHMPKYQVILQLKDNTEASARFDRLQCYELRRYRTDTESGKHPKQQSAFLYYEANGLKKETNKKPQTLYSELQNPNL